MISILLALKDAKQRAELGAILRVEGFITVVVGTHESPRRALETSKVDIVVLDRTHYGKNLLADIRDRLDLRIVAIVKNSQDRVQALASGADYAGLFGDGLIAQLHAMERRIAPRGVVSTASFIINVDQHSVVRGTEAVWIPKLEFELLLFLVSQPRKVFTHAQIYREIWGVDMGRKQLDAVAQRMSHLRRLVEDDPMNPRHLVTVRGAGYRFDP